ncbi:MAG: glycogen/starch synthase [Bacteroidales bacterium]|nr:glycogen/starch synthase [Bacteroidales bacterium]
MKKNEVIKPDYIFEASWEVCNKVGGIYTVLSSKAKVMNAQNSDSHIYIGPDLGSSNSLYFTEDSSLLKKWQTHFHKTTGLKVRIGRWNIPGNPIALLINFSPLCESKNEFYGDMWEKYKVNSLNAYGDYDEACTFAHATGILIENFYNFFKLDKSNVIAHFHEWTMGMGLLYVKDKLPDVGTVFTTHATSIGRSIAGNGKALYAFFNGYNGDIMANELNMQAKHSLEKQAAHFADCFTTVSDITARECTQLLEKTPDIVTPNGFENDMVPKGSSYTAKRKSARNLLKEVTACLTGHQPSDDAILVAISGRYEYRNKGIDLFIKAIDDLKQSNPEKEVIAFIMVPGWIKEAREDLVKRKKSKTKENTPLPQPFLTHWLNNPNEDKISNYILQLGFTNQASDKVKIIFVPCYLNGDDGIFNKNYYDLLAGMNLTIFPSYYEPWGYTPHESVAFGIPTITTQLAGFGAWAAKEQKEINWKHGADVILREEDNYLDVAKAISGKITEVSKASSDEIKQVRRQALNLAEKATWEHFVRFYFEAYNFALQKKKQNTQN